MWFCISSSIIQQDIAIYCHQPLQQLWPCPCTWHSWAVDPKLGDNSWASPAQLDRRGGKLGRENHRLVRLVTQQQLCSLNWRKQLNRVSVNVESIESMPCLVALVKSFFTSNKPQRI
jgi:hypothetical protein